MAITTNTVQLTNVLNQAFGADDITLEIASGAADYSNNSGTAALSSGAAHTGLLVLNYGNILNSAGFAIDFTANTGGTIINEPGGAIAGSAALNTDSTGLSIVNFGSMTGTDLTFSAVVMDTPSSGVVLDNRGIIYGHGEGVTNLSHSGINRIGNSGVIDAQTYGIECSASAGLTTYIVNSGTICGTTAVFGGSGGVVNLVNSGQIFGLITSSVPRTILSRTPVSFRARLTSAPGTTGSSVAGEGPAPLFGEVGQDHLSAGKSNDIVSGGPGNDTLTGGPGRTPSCSTPCSTPAPMSTASPTSRCPSTRSN